MTVYLLQAVAVAASGSLGGHATDIGIAIILGINVWQVKATMTFRDEARTLRQWAFGPEGNNGINSTVKDHTARLDDLEDELPHTHKRKTDR